jgi:hypothetical protein
LSGLRLLLRAIGTDHRQDLGLGLDIVITEELSLLTGQRNIEFSP